MTALTKSTRLTAADVEAALADDRHLGYGFHERALLPAASQVRLTRVVAEIATEAGWAYEDLFHWTNSKFGRHLISDVMGPRLNGEALRHVVRNYINEATRQQSQEF